MIIIVIKKNRKKSITPRFADLINTPKIKVVKAKGLNPIQLFLNFQTAVLT